MNYLMLIQCQQGETTTGQTANAKEKGQSQDFQQTTGLNRYKSRKHIQAFSNKRKILWALHVCLNTVRIHGRPYGQVGQRMWAAYPSAWRHTEHGALCRFSWCKLAAAALNESFPPFAVEQLGGLTSARISINLQMTSGGAHRAQAKERAGKYAGGVA